MDKRQYPLHHATKFQSFKPSAVYDLPGFSGAERVASFRESKTKTGRQMSTFSAYPERRLYADTWRGIDIIHCISFYSYVYIALVVQPLALVTTQRQDLPPDPLVTRLSHPSFQPVTSFFIACTHKRRQNGALTTTYEAYSRASGRA